MAIFNSYVNVKLPEAIHFWDGIASSAPAPEHEHWHALVPGRPHCGGERFGMAPALQICCDISMDWFKGKSTGKPHI